MADEEVQTIVDLRSKVQGLMKWAKEAGVTKLSTLRALERTCGIKYSTLNSSLNAERISIGNQMKLATAFEFQIDWPEWRMAAGLFLERFRTHKLASRPLTIEARLTRTHLDRRTADFAFGVAGSFDGCSENNGIPLVLSLSFDNRGWPVFPDLTVALKEVDLQLSCTRDGAELEVFALTCNCESEGNFHSEVMGTGQGYAYWTIRVADPACEFIAGTRRKNDGRDCICKGFRDGDEIRALMTARKIQCFGTVAGKSVENSGPIKKRFVEHLTKLDVLNGTEAKLAEQILTVVHKL
jgi:hypothetical protein